MMDQMFKKSSAAEQKAAAELTGLKDQFTKIKETPLTRVVRLVMKSCCGCGCDDVTVKRTVPYDSKLQDGDRIRESQMERGDKII